MAFVHGVPLSFERPFTASRKSLSRSKSRPVLMMASDGSSKPAQFPEEDPVSGATQRMSAEEMVRRDMEALKAQASSEDDVTSGLSAMQMAKDIVSGILLWDFFLVVGLLAWLLISLVPHFAYQNDVLLDPWLRLWGPFIQPVLGVLMVGTVVQGTISFLSQDNKP